MNKADKLKKVFNTNEICYNSLMGFEVNKCPKCKSEKFYDTICNYDKSCKNCKTKYKTTYNTLFHNVRFGLVKAFHIYIDIIFIFIYILRIYLGLPRFLRTSYEPNKLFPDVNKSPDAAGQTLRN